MAKRKDDSDQNDEEEFMIGKVTSMSLLVEKTIKKESWDTYPKQSLTSLNLQRCVKVIRSDRG